MASESCISKEVLETAFRAAEGRDDVTVLDFKVSKGANFGDGFMTSILRAEVQLKVGEVTKSSMVVIKTLSENTVMKEIAKESGVFRKEIGFYHTILPRLVKFQKERNVLNPLLPSVPKSYSGYEDETAAYLVFEDLKPLGFKMADVRKGLDENHCQLAVKEFAKLHALSLAFKKGNRQAFDKDFLPFLSEEIFQEEIIKKFDYDNQIKQTFNKCLDAFKSTTKNDELKEKMATTVERHRSDPLGTMLKILHSPNEQFSVICHGDAWCNNMLFRYEDEDQEKRPLGVKLLDLQMIFYAPPTIDLSVFFFTSTTQELRRQHLDDLLRLYHRTFMETLNKVNINLPEFTFECLKEMFAKTALFGVMMALDAIPGMLADRSNLGALEATTTAEDMMVSFNNMSNDEKYGELMKKRQAEVVEDAIMMEL